MRILFVLFALTFFTACDRIDLSDISTTTSATTAAVGTAFITTNPIAIGAATATSAVAGAYLVKDDKSLTTEQIKEVENPWQAMLVAFDQLLAHAFELVIAIGIAAVGIPMLITYLMGRFKQRPEDAKTINNLVEKIGKMKEND
tara:strand:+ start:440 stop:871 length:432 start_codon:yes stop_codon:yes gene_type:complete